MSRTTSETFEAQMIGGIFSTHDPATEAINGAQNLDITRQDIQVLFPLSDQQAKEAFVRGLISAIRSGDILTRRHDVAHPVPVIEITDKHQLEYHPVGNHRDHQLILPFETLPVGELVKG